MKQQHTPDRDEECMQRYEEMKSGSAWRAVVFRLTNDEFMIVVDQTIPASAPFSEFRASFPDQDIRWALVDFPYRTTSGGIRSKLTFITWVPDTLRRETFRESVRVKSTGVIMSGVLLRDMRAVVCKMQANDQDDLAPRTMLDKVSKFDRDTVDLASVNDLLHLTGAEMLSES
jgi:cofilin